MNRMAQTSQPRLSWVSLWGEFEEGNDEITFHGYPYTPSQPLQTSDAKGADVAAEPQQPRGGVGRVLSNRRLTDGKVSVDIEFTGVDPVTTAEITLQHDPVTDEMLNVGLGANLLVSVRHWTRATDNMSQQKVSTSTQPQWKVIRSVGDRRALKPGRSYHLEVNVKGSFITVQLDGVELGSGDLPFQLSGKSVGLFTQSLSDIHFRHFRVESERPLAFVVMQFSPPEYEELFNDVIVPVCDKMGLQPFRASQTYYPGLVIADIQRQIRESRVVIAEITPVNPNVYYELGYADAIGKPVILIADGGKLDQLPFDVRAFRTLFYENTIGGKNKVETTLTEFLKNIMSQS
jgi:hypothetical protein